MYEIVITQKVLKKVPAGEDWEIIDKRPYNKEEVDKMDEMYKKSLGELALKEVYGYTPKTIKEEHVEVDILKQTVMELDLPAVIKAINRL